MKIGYLEFRTVLKTKVAHFHPVSLHNIKHESKENTVLLF